MAYGADNDQVKQDRQIDEMIASGVQVLLINLVDVQTGADVVDKVRKAGIPAIFFNREPDLGTLRSYKQSCFVGTRVEEAGRLQGNVIKGLWEKHPEYDRNQDGLLQFVMLQGEENNPEAVARTLYSVRRAMDVGVPLRQVGETHICEWDEKLAAEAMRQELAAHADSIELVIANNDAMALGAVTALQEHGYNHEGGPVEKFIPVVGVDAIPAAVEAIGRGVMSATVEQNSESMVKALVALTLNAASGRGFLVGTPYVWDGDVAVRIPYKVFRKTE